MIFYPLNQINRQATLPAPNELLRNSSRVQSCPASFLPVTTIFSSLPEEGVSLGFQKSRDLFLFVGFKQKLLNKQFQITFTDARQNLA
jgi:hypothetical protein